MFVCPICKSSLDYIGDSGMCGSYDVEYLNAMFECYSCSRAWNIKCSPVEFEEVMPQISHGMPIDSSD